MDESIKVLIVDDDVEYASALGNLFAKQQKITVIGTAASGYQALDLIPQIHPEIVLLDIDMPGMDGIETTKCLVERFPNIKIVILSAYTYHEHVERVLAYVAKGFLVKGLDVYAMIDGLQAVKMGKTVLDKVPQTILISSAQRKAKARESYPEFVKGLDELSQRFRSLLPYLVRGLSDKNIARQLNLSVKTVHNYVQEILYATECSSRTEFTFKALATGLVAIPDDLMH